ncbi:hypothetical protein M3Y97_01113600 [Aphelenchoides bicaudatus]|nr:hypothetical protein M3Y97_01113600 [Aphelenchoides bicaudatus]
MIAQQLHIPAGQRASCSWPKFHLRFLRDAQTLRCFFLNLPHPGQLSSRQSIAFVDNYHNGQTIPMTSNVIGLEREVFQHGSVGDFLGSSLEGVQSGFYSMRLHRQRSAKQHSYVAMMTGVFVLLAFVLLVFIIGACSMIICYQRSKIRQRREEKEAYEFVEAQLNNYPPTPIGPLGPGNGQPTMGYSTYNTHPHRY